MSKKVRLNLDVSAELNKSLDDIAEASHTSKSEIIRKAFALILAAREAKTQGLSLGLIDRKKNRVVREIIGI